MAQFDTHQLLFIDESSKDERTFQVIDTDYSIIIIMFCAEVNYTIRLIIDCFSDLYFNVCLVDFQKRRCKRLQRFKNIY